MAASLMVVIGPIEVRRSEMAGPWILRIGGVIDTSTVLVLVLISIMIIIVIILTGGVIGDTF